MVRSAASMLRHYATRDLPPNWRIDLREMALGCLSSPPPLASSKLNSLRRHAAYSSSCASHRINHLDSLKIPLVVRDDRAIMSEGGGGEDGVDAAAGAAFGGAGGHEFGPMQRGDGIEGQDAARKEGGGALRSDEPIFQSAAFFAGGLFENPTLNFGEGQRGDEKVCIDLRRHPVQ